MFWEANRLRNLTFCWQHIGFPWISAAPFRSSGIHQVQATFLDQKMLSLMQEFWYLWIPAQEGGVYYCQGICQDSDNAYTIFHIYRSETDSPSIPWAWWHPPSGGSGRDFCCHIFIRPLFFLGKDYLTKSYPFPLLNFKIYNLLSLCSYSQI